MTSNNLEAIELLKGALKYSNADNVKSLVRSAIALLQADTAETPPVSTKETKLRELKKSILYGTTEPGGGLMELISILLEEEY